MIRSVSFEKTTYNDLPYKFEAGTPDIAGGIGLGAAIDYLDGMDREKAYQYEQDLLTYGTEALSEMKGLKIIGTAKLTSRLVGPKIQVGHRIQPYRSCQRVGHF